MNHLGTALVFAKVVEQRSFTQAARSLGLTKAMVSRSVQELERHLGVRLLQRSTRQLALTEVGATYYEYCARIVTELDAAESAVGKLRSVPRGKLRLLAPHSLGALSLGNLLAQFMTRYPEVTVTLVLSNEHPDLIRDEIDLAICIGPFAQLSFPSRLLGVATPKLYAAPGYLERAGVPKSLEELRNHQTLSMARWERNGRYVWELVARGRRQLVQITPTLVTNSVPTLAEAALAGQGIALIGSGSFNDALAKKGLGSSVLTEAFSRNRLLPVLREWSAAPVELRAFYASRRDIAPKVRAFLDFLLERVSVV